MGPGSPFPGERTDKSFAQPKLIEHLSVDSRDRPGGKAGCETWCSAWSPDARYFAWSQGNRTVELIPWNRDKHTTVAQSSRDLSGEALAPCQPVTIDVGHPVWSLAFGSSITETKPQSTNLNWYRYKEAKHLLLATGLSNGRIRIWDVKTGKLYLQLVDHKDVVRDLKFSPDGSLRLVSASADGTLKVWDLKDDGNMVKTLKGPSKSWFGCSWSPDSKLMCSVGDSRSVIVWDMSTYTQLRRLHGHNHDVSCCDFSPDGAVLATSSYDTRVILWDPYTGEKLLELKHMFPAPSPIYAGGANGSYVRGVSFSHDAAHVCTVADDGYVRFWDIESDSDAPCQVVRVSDPLCVSYSPDGMCAAVGTRSGSVTLWLAPMTVLSLQQFCRTAIRRTISTHKVDSLPLPQKIKHYVQYKA